MAASAKDDETLRSAVDSVNAAEVPLQRLEKRLLMESTGDETLQNCLASIKAARRSVQKLSQALRAYMASQ